jgi:3-hydroxybutyryl-CoA dehydrogenase
MGNMIIAILADDVKNEMLSKGVASDVEIIWVDSLRSLRMIEADAYFDLQFENSGERISALKALLPKPVFISDVNGTCAASGNVFTRINGWPTMIGRNLVEIAAPEELKETSMKCLEKIGWHGELIPDVPGMITPRIVAMIINEAYYALQEGVSNREQIDIAMKMGTNYPYGPFEWMNKIGRDRVCGLLNSLSRTDPRYTVAPMLKTD